MKLPGLMPATRSAPITPQNAQKGDDDRGMMLLLERSRGANNNDAGLVNISIGCRKGHCGRSATRDIRGNRKEGVYSRSQQQTAIFLLWFVISV